MVLRICGKAVIISQKQHLLSRRLWSLVWSRLSKGHGHYCQVTDSAWNLIIYMHQILPFLSSMSRVPITVVGLWPHPFSSRWGGREAALHDTFSWLWTLQLMTRWEDNCLVSVYVKFYSMIKGLCKVTSSHRKSTRWATRENTRCVWSIWTQTLFPSSQLPGLWEETRTLWRDQQEVSPGIKRK